MANAIIKEVDAQTGKAIEREMNAEELAQWEAAQLEAEAKVKAETQAAAAKAALLEKLGITEDEAKLLLS